MGHLVGNDGGKLGLVLHLQDGSSGDEDVPSGGGICVYVVGIKYGDVKIQFGPVIVLFQCLGNEVYILCQFRIVVKPLLAENTSGHLTAELELCLHVLASGAADPVRIGKPGAEVASCYGGTGEKANHQGDYQEINK